jgi:phage-related protein
MEELKIVMSLDSESFDTGMRQATKKLETFQEKLNAVSDGLKKAGSVMSVAGTAITGAIAGIVAKSSEWSAEVESTEFIYERLDSSIQEVITANQENAKSMGMTQKQYKQNATALSSYYKNMGFTSDEIANMSSRSMELVADLSALADVPVDDAMGDFKSALMGNYEALDKYGINISASTLENSEFVKSLGKSWSKLSDNEKMMAVYNEAIRQSSDATGLAVEEAGSFNSQMKYLQERIGEVVGEIGENLLPVLEPLLQKVVEVVESVSQWVAENPELTRTILVVAMVIGVLLVVVGLMTTAIGFATGAITAFTAVSWPVVGAVAGIIAVITALVVGGIALYKNWDTIKEKAGQIWGKIKTAITDKVKEIKTNISNTFDNIKTSLIEKMNNIKKSVSDIWDGIKNIFTSPIKAVVNFVKGGSKMALPEYTPIASSYGSTMTLARAGALTASSAGSGGAPISLSANMNTTVQLDGKTIAKASAPYMNTELNKIDKRKNRLGGRF